MASSPGKSPSASEDTATSAVEPSPFFLYVQLWAAFKRPITRCRRLLDCFNPISARAPGCISADPSIRLMGGGFSSEVDWKSEIDLTHWRPYAVFSFTVVFTSYLHHFSLPSPPLPPEQG